MKLDPNNYWNPEIFKKNASLNINQVKKTIADIQFNEEKVLICGRGESSHPDFYPRFSTPTTNIDSTFYVTVDHHPSYAQYITKKGSYALSLIVDPIISEKIHDLEGEVFWFSHDFLDYDLPKIISGKFPRGNSGLSAISLASYLNVKFILLSGIKFTGLYSQFFEGKEIVFENVNKFGAKIFSLDGIIADKLSYDDWCKL